MIHPLIQEQEFLMSINAYERIVSATVQLGKCHLSSWSSKEVKGTILDSLTPVQRTQTGLVSRENPPIPDGLSGSAA